MQQERSAVMLGRLRAEGLKLTAQRRAIVKRFAADESHPTAQELYERLRGEFPKMSFATVYNTLDALTHAGLSSTIRFSPVSAKGVAEGGGREASAARFDPNITPHHHAVCDRCGAVADVPYPEGERTRIERPKSRGSQSAASLDTPRVLHKTVPGFSLRSVERIYRGLCAKCAPKKNSKRRN